MSGAKRRSGYRKSVVDQTRSSFPVPRDQERVCRIVELRGGNIVQVETCDGERRWAGVFPLPSMAIPSVADASARGFFACRVARDVTGSIQERHLHQSWRLCHRSLRAGRPQRQGPVDRHAGALRAPDRASRRRRRVAHLRRLRSNHFHRASLSLAFFAPTQFLEGQRRSETAVIGRAAPHQSTWASASTTTISSRI